MKLTVFKYPLTAALWLVAALTLRSAEPASRPNILWISSEDHGPHMGCYGDAYAATPNVDGLAKRGMRYLHAWSCAPVCAPARTTIISGMYPPSTGSEHMRSLVAYPAGKQMFPQLLRDKAGYYCTNNAKEDYNLAAPGKVWDDSSKKAHWRGRAGSQPFFAVFNSVKSHESQIRTRPHKAVHDPAKAPLPSYHPDTPEVRQDWAQYYDQVSEADGDAGKVLEQLAADGLAEDTIVFYWADHGSGMPRGKRFPGNSGLQVPLVVYFPEKWRSLAPAEYQPGGSSDRLVSFVDFAPTMLSLAGLAAPEWMQGHAFAGKFPSLPQPFVYGFRGRMDERDDLSRSVTDGRYVYIRNYRPDLPWGQHVDYMFQTPATRVWKQLFDDGKLNAAQSRFWEPKGPEELYDLQSDPEELRNLAGDLQAAAIQLKLRTAQQDLARRIRDTGFLREGDRFVRGRESSIYEFGADPAKFPFERIFSAAEQASMMSPAAVPALKTALSDSECGVRYWGALGLSIRGAETVQASAAELRGALKDPSPLVRIVAAEGLARFGSETDRNTALSLLAELAAWDRQDFFTAFEAVSALDNLGTLAGPVTEAIRKLPNKGPVPHPRYAPILPDLIAHLRETLGLP